MFGFVFCFVVVPFLKLVKTLIFGKWFNISLRIVTVLLSVNWSTVSIIVTFKREVTDQRDFFFCLF